MTESLFGFRDRFLGAYFTWDDPLPFVYKVKPRVKNMICQVLCRLCR
jgi:hypothetical protein